MRLTRCLRMPITDVQLKVIPYPEVFKKTVCFLLYTSNEGSINSMTLQPTSQTLSPAANIERTKMQLLYKAQRTSVSYSTMA